jgi:SpoVK/Ycf46/Vps4 family AAA+-type ATPase
MNAVVGVFLRVLEYFNGLLFLTTNRVDDIDEAIVSRCIALIKYYPPDDDAHRRIWGVMAGQFELSLDKELIDELVATFPAATGRDINGLAKLVAKFRHQKQVPPDIEVFRRYAIFRGLNVVSAKALEPAFSAYARTGAPLSSNKSSVGSSSPMLIRARERTPSARYS